MGTPAYYWAAAKETYAAGDYIKTVQHLANLNKTDSEYSKRAQAWYLVMTAGMAKGNAELGDYFEHGAKANRPKATAFRRQSNDFRTMASRLTLEFAEAFEKFEASNKDAEIVLEYAYPPGSAIQAPILTKIGSGQLPTEAKLEEIRKQHLETAMLQVTSRVIGVADDQAKAQQVFKTLPVKVDRNIFFREMAALLNEKAQLYSRTKLDDPRRMEFLAKHAMEALKTVPESKETKEVAAKIEKTLKALKSN